MSETYSLNSFTFESRESYEQAKKETEIIEQLKENTDLSNARTALKVYNKSISEKVFHTVAGYYFLLELRRSILESGLVTERALAQIPIQEPLRTRNDVIPHRPSQEGKFHKLYEGQRLLNKKLKIALAAAVLILAGFVIINFRFEYTIFTYFTNYKDKMENELIDKYEHWEEELETRERQLEQ